MKNGFYTPKSRIVQRMKKVLRDYEKNGHTQHVFAGLCNYVDCQIKHTVAYDFIAFALPKGVHYISGNQGWSEDRSKIAPLIAEYLEVGFSVAFKDMDGVIAKIYHTPEGKRIRRRIYYILNGK